MALQLPTGSRTGSLLLPPPAPHPEGLEKLHCTFMPPCRAPSALWAITCLLEDMLVSVLMLLVSVTTMAEGKREVWEYWGGSCLCAYTADSKGTAQGKATPALATAGPGMGTGSGETGMG